MQMTAVAILNVGKLTVLTWQLHFYIRLAWFLSSSVRIDRMVRTWLQFTKFKMALACGVGLKTYCMFYVTKLYPCTDGFKPPYCYLDKPIFQNILIRIRRFRVQTHNFRDYYGLLGVPSIWDAILFATAFHSSFQPFRDLGWETGHDTITCHINQNRSLQTTIFISRSCFKVVEKVKSGKTGQSWDSVR